MAGLLETVDSRTQLAGKNRLELLLFRFDDKQLYGINVFKVREILKCPPLSHLPGAHHVVCGVATVRGKAISILDLAHATGLLALRDRENAYVIVTEYNGRTQGFLVSAVEHIVNLNWEGIHPPPRGSGRNNYLTAVTNMKGELVEIIDVEKVLNEVSPASECLSDGKIDEAIRQQANRFRVLVVDDSSVARRQVSRCLQAVGVQVLTCNDGRQALSLLHEMVEGRLHQPQDLLMVISDIEMPEMDGYTLTAEVRANPHLSDLHIVLHTSLSGAFNENMVKKVGANQFLAKFQPDELAGLVMDRIRESALQRSFEEARQPCSSF
ncbi:response regulator [Pseudomonas sp. NY5710]|uniref:chemotaxis protein CheV n=1 Tax=Pseudomonas sp. NY5710 TaxID=2662033 RepID=UPI00156E18C8|nr:chemotaxis protein CheV [Pseudomonas sp. NY5710]QKL00791.1 response regulator [Pseudomonas sp. NY5710]